MHVEHRSSRRQIFSQDIHCRLGPRTGPMYDVNLLGMSRNENAEWFTPTGEVKVIWCRKELITERGMIRPACMLPVISNGRWLTVISISVPSCEDQLVVRS
eukprot:1161653-Pelagomonas_calceolata.AAC.2